MHGRLTQAAHTGGPHRRRSLLGGIGVLALLAAVSMHPVRAADPWHYTLGQTRADQQANFCADRETVLAIAAVFRQQGPRPGYEALDRANGCIIAVRSFTPRRLVEQVRIAMGDGGQYTVSFIEVEMMAGPIAYVVTTREVRR